MKKHMLKYIMVLAAAVVAVSCLKNDVPQGNKDGDRGTLVIPGVGVSEDLTDKAHGTRAVSTDDFNVRISCLDTDTECHNCTYSSLEQQMTLPVGNYVINVQSHECPAAEWENIYYSVSQNFEIKKDETTTLDDLVCLVSNILVSVRFSDYMKDFMGSDCVVEVKIGNCGPLSYDVDELRRGTFKAEQETNTLVWDFSGTLQGAYYHNTSFIRNVKAGEHRTLNFDIDRDPEGDATFAFRVSVDCTTYDVNLNVDVTEDVIEPFDPGIEITSDYSLTERTTIKKSELAAANLGFNIAAEEGISSLMMEITTDNAALAAEMATRGITGEFDLASPGALEAVLQELGLPTGADVSGKTLLDLDLAKVASMIVPFGNTGKFDVRIEVRDLDANVATATLRLKYVDDSGPFELSIVWRDYDITQKYTFYSSLHLIEDPDEGTVSLVPIKIDIVASEGIKNLFVEIISNNEVFGEETLTEIGLATMFDLVNPDNVDPDRLEAFGFPMGDEVRDQPAVSFDITQFLPLIFMVSTEGADEVTFRLTVVDNSGNTEIQSIQLKTVNDQ